MNNLPKVVTQLLLRVEIEPSPKLYPLRDRDIEKLESNPVCSGEASPRLFESGDVCG